MQRKSQVYAIGIALCLIVASALFLYVLYLRPHSVQVLFLTEDQRATTASITADFLPSRLESGSYNNQVNPGAEKLAMSMMAQYVSAGNRGGLGNLIVWDNTGYQFQLRAQPSAEAQQKMWKLLRPFSSPASAVAVAGRSKGGDQGVFVTVVPTSALKGKDPAVRLTSHRPWILAYGDESGLCVAYLDDPTLSELGRIIGYKDLLSRIRGQQK